MLDCASQAGAAIRDLLGTSGWSLLATEFEVGQSGGEVEFICELRGHLGRLGMTLAPCESGDWTDNGTAGMHAANCPLDVNNYFAENSMRLGAAEGPALPPGMTGFMKRIQRAAFTLIELLVVIAIIATLPAWFCLRWPAARPKRRTSLA